MEGYGPSGNPVMAWPCGSAAGGADRDPDRDWERERERGVGYALATAPPPGALPLAM